MSANVIAAAAVTMPRECAERSADIKTVDTRTQDVKPQVLRRARYVGSWNPQNFAAEQIRGLVRQIFFSGAVRPVRQVVFSAIEAQTDVRVICRRVGEALTLETAEGIAVAGEYPRIVPDLEELHQAPVRGFDNDSALRSGATCLRGNLWLVPSDVGSEELASTASLHSLMCNLRRQFEFSIVEAPPASESFSAAAMAQLADGIVLVLSARNTRPPAARKAKEMFEASRVRILGTVLIDRVFPIPQGIYQRL